MKPLNLIKSSLILFTLITIMVANSLCFSESLTVKLEAGEYSMDVTHKGKDRIVAPKLGMMQVPGKPAMPAKIFYVAIPPDAEVSNVSFEVDSNWLDGKYNIEPGEMVLPARNFTKEEFEAAKREYERNFDLTYSQDEPYPSQCYSYVGEGGFRKYKLVRIQYAPWQYYPKSKRILYTPEIEVKIKFKRLGTLDKHVKLSDTIKEDQARDIILNYDAAQEWYMAAEAMEPVPRAASDYRYIIMCTEATESAVEVLADWKRSIGYRVHVFTKEWLEANAAYSSYELERKIRYYLRDNYLTWNAEYFLIVGDNDVIPMRDCTAGDGGTTPAHTDAYYGELSDWDSSSWDDDWDGNYAEYTEDSIDWLMELDVGRIPDNDPGVVELICQKTRDFEMDTGAWKKRGLFLASFFSYANEDGSGHPKTDNAYVVEEMMNDWSWPGWYHCTMYEQEGIDPSVFSSIFPLTDAMVRLVWDDGQYSLVNMAGHGGGYGVARRVWDWDDGDGIPEWGNNELSKPGLFDRDDISALNNDHPSIVFFSSCSCGEYDAGNAVAKELLHTGAVSTIAAAGTVGFGYGWQNYTHGYLQTFQYLWNKRFVNSGQRVGTALMNAKTDFNTSYNWGAGSQRILLNMNLYGDPALLRSGTTLRPNLDYYKPASWHYTVVPRSSNDATSSWCPVSSTLPGNTNNTYLNFGIMNNGNVTAYDVRNNLYIDDAFVKWAGWGWIGAGVSATFPNIGPFTVKGGRHTVKVFYDPNNELTESNESDNVWKRQYVWSPYQLTNQVPVWRTAPPDPGSGTYYNCDGFSAQMGVGEFWCAVGIMPYDEGDNNDIRLHTDYTGSTNGFDNYHKWSADPGDRTDFCIVNRNQTGSTGPYYFGVVKRSGGNNGFRIQQANSGTILSTTSINGLFTIHGWDVLDMHEVYLTPATWKIRLEIASGTANLGLSMYARSGSYFSKGNYMSGGYSNSGGRGEDESFTITISESGFYGIVVWKSDSNDYGYLNTYYLGISQDIFVPSPMSQIRGAGKPHLRRKSDGLVRLTFVSHLRVVRSVDGRSIDSTAGARFEPQTEYEEFGVEDPRITAVGDRFYFTYVAVSRHGAATALASTIDFQSFERYGIIFHPENKDVVLFPEQIDSQYLALHRPNAATPFTRPEMWLARSPDLTHWGGHEYFLGCIKSWETGRIGAGTPPIHTSEGWLEIYHGNRQSKDKDDAGTYSAGALLLDKEDPRKIIRQSTGAILSPEAGFERAGFLPNVVFPTGIVEQDKTILIYYGAADTVAAVVEFSIEELLESLH